MVVNLTHLITYKTISIFSNGIFSMKNFFLSKNLFKQPNYTFTIFRFFGVILKKKKPVGFRQFWYSDILSNFEICLGICPCKNLTVFFLFCQIDSYSVITFFLTRSKNEKNPFRINLDVIHYCNTPGKILEYSSLEWKKKQPKRWFVIQFIK